MVSDITTRSRASLPSVRELLDQAKAIEQEDSTASRILVQQARVLARSQGDEPGEAEAFYRLASLAYYGGQADEAFGVAVDARDLARKCGAVVVEVWALNLMGIVHFNAGNHSEALSCCLRGLEQYRTTDHRVDEGNLLNTVAAIHHELGDTDRAIVTYEAALSANRQLARPDFDAITLNNMAQLRAERREFFLAVSLGESALELSREHAPGFMPEVLASLGEAYASLSDHRKASDCFDDALRILDERAQRGTEGSPTGVISVRLARGKSALADGDLMMAEQDLLIALDVAQRSNVRPSELRAHELLATVYKRLGRHEAALAQQEARFELHQDLFNQGTDLRIKTLQIAHDTEHARQQAEILRLRTSELEALVRGRTHDLEEYQLEAFQRLAVLAEFRDTDTGEHTIRVGDLSAEIAYELGENAAWCEQLRLAARLHDIGKVAVPDAILLKPGPLTVDEFEVMKTHTTIGAQILSGSTSLLIQLGAVVAMNHHERWDGTGYPAGLHNTDIPRCGRIVTVADVFDALTSVRVYKHAWSQADAVAYIVGARGTQFEPEVVDAFLAVITRRIPALRNVVTDSRFPAPNRQHH
ncbi:MAG: HD domain-containing phosphohydrolase [Ilumatobacteraceae bacterium]